MSNNRNRIVFPAEFGRLQPQLAPAVQGGEPTYTLHLVYQDGTVYPLADDDVLEIVYQDTSDDEVYSTSSGLSVSDAEAGIVTWAAAAALGLAGSFWLQLKVNDETSLRVKWKVEAALDASGTTPPVAMTSLTAAQVALVQTLATLSGLANFNGAGSAAAIKINLSAAAAPTTGDDTGDGYTVGSLWLDTTNDKAYICLDATLGAAIWTEITGGGGGDVSSVFGRTGAVVATSGDYGTDEIADDSDYAKPSLTAALNAIAQTDANQDLSIAGKQDSSAKLTAIAALTWAANSIIKLTSTSAAAVVTLASHVWTFLQSADAAAARSAIGAGTGNGDLLATNNLSELTATASTARTNLGLGTLATQSGTFSGGGTLATGGFTLTIPATGTAALLATANIFTTFQQIAVTNSSATGLTTTNSGAAADTVGIRGNAQTGIGVQGLTNSGVAIEGFLQAAASTSAINTTLRLASRASGTPGAGFGTQILYRLESSTTNDVDAGRLAVLWNTATHASRVPDVVQYLTDSAAEREIWRGRATGSAAAIAFLGATPVARQAHIADASGDDAATVNAILDVLEAFGLVATS